MLLALVEGYQAKQAVAVLANVPVVVAVAWGLRASSGGPALAAWAGVVAGSAVLRLVPWWALRRRFQAGAASARRWLAWSFLGTLTTALLWGGGLLAFLPAAGTAERLFVATVISGMVAGSAATLADHLPSFLAFTVPTVLPVVVVLGRSDHPLERIIGPLGLIYVGAITLVAWMSGRRLRGALRHRFRSEGLVAELTAAQASLSALNAELEARVAARGEELARAERALAQAALLASVGRLAAGVAHEINNPLSSVLANLRFAEQALAEGVPEEVPATREALADAREAAVRVSATVRSLRAVAGANAEGQPLDVRDLLEACAAVAAPELRRRAVLVRELAPVPPVHAAAPGLAQVLVQLLVSAGGSLPEGDPTRSSVRLATRLDDAGAAVLVEIEARPAPGAPEAPGEAPAAEATGLRLAQEAVTRLGGALAARRGPGGAAAFQVTLPLGRAG